MDKMAVVVVNPERTGGILKEAIEEYRKEFEENMARFTKTLGREPTFEEYLAVNLLNLRGFLEVKNLIKEFVAGPEHWTTPEEKLGRPTRPPGGFH